MNRKVGHDEDFWFQSFKKGEDKGLAYFFDLHYKSLCYFASRFIQDDTEAQDIVANCFFKLWEKQYDVQSTESIKAFLYISCRNACLDHLKHLKVKSAAQETYYRQLELGGQDMLNKIIETEVLEMLEMEIDLLPEKCGQVFKLLYLEHKKTDEIAEVLGISPKTVRNHKAKAIELLKIAVLTKWDSDVLYLAFLLFLDKR